MRYLTLEQRESLQRQLTERAAQLREEIAAALRGSGDTEAMALANHLDEIDDAVADLESSIDVAEIERHVGELGRIESALGRLHEPDFGVCADCGAEIPYSRLSAEPSATRCISCHTKAERSRADRQTL
ncbi:MAG TPA: TraR/DksA family transcriptional regulator [Burkholderiales bacterium]